MPSGAKKRKAAKKKLQKEGSNNGAHHRGNDDTKSHDERESDGGEVEREPSEEGVVEDHEEGTKEVSLGEENAAENADEVMAEENLNDVIVETEDVIGESQNGDDSEEHKSSSSSSSSSSSEDEEVAVEKEKLVVAEPESGEVVHQGERSFSEVVVPEETPKLTENVPEEVSSENSGSSEVVHHSSEEGIPVEESVKEVVSIPPESCLVTESVPVENIMTSEMTESEMKQMMDEVLQPSDDKDKISSAVLGLAEEKLETKVVQVVEMGSEKLHESVDVTQRENEVLLPQSSGVTSLERNGGGDHVKDSEKQKHSYEQPLVSSAPIPVQRTSLMDCCGIFEVFSGGSRR